MDRKVANAQVTIAHLIIFPHPPPPLNLAVFVFVPPYSSFLVRVEDPPTRGGVGDVEWVVFGSNCRVIPSLDDEGVVSAAFHNQLGNEGVIDVPGNAPPCLTCRGGGEEERG